MCRSRRDPSRLRLFVFVIWSRLAKYPSSPPGACYHGSLYAPLCCMHLPIAVLRATARDSATTARCQLGQADSRHQHPPRHQPPLSRLMWCLVLSCAPPHVCSGSFPPLALWARRRCPVVAHGRDPSPLCESICDVSSALTNRYLVQGATVGPLSCLWAACAPSTPPTPLLRR